MSNDKPKVFWAGAGIVWRRQRVLWLVFAVSLFLSYIGVRGLVARVRPALDHSSDAAPRLYHHFDVSAIAELTSLPEQPLTVTSPPYMLTSLLFAIFMLFATGGVLAAYRRDENLSMAEFFGACGDHFWRFLRLLVYFAIAFIPVATLASICGAAYNHMDDVSVSPLSAVYFAIAATVVVVFFAISIRLWFDMAQVIAVAEGERRMHKALRQAAGLVRRNFGSLFWLYLRISLVGTFFFGMGLYWWMIHLRPESTGKAFLLSQLIILVWIGTRLWQRASETAWYGENQAAVREPAPPAPVSSHAPELVAMN